MDPDFANRRYNPEDWNNYYWHRRRHRIRQARMMPAIVLIAVGAIFFLNNLHIFDFRDLLRYWPVILIGVGMLKLVDSHDHGSRLGGAILTVVGAIFLAPKLGFWDVSIGELWPLILIGVGGLLLLQRLSTPGLDPASPRANAVPNGSLNESAVFSGGKRRIVSPDFRGGEVSCIFGGFDIDLRKAGIAGDSAVLIVNAVFGGCDIKVPEYWDVVMEVSAVFGGCDDHTTHPDPTLPGVKKLYLRGSAVFGGIDVKN